MTRTVRWNRSAPEVATARVTGGLIGLLYLLGGVAVLAVVLLPSSASPTAPVLPVIGLVALLTGALLVGWGWRLPRPVFHGLVVLGTALISTVVLAAADTGSAMALAGMYSFVAVAAFFLFPPLPALVHLGTAVAACAVVLSLRGLPPGTVAAPTIVTGTIALVVALLVHRASSASLDTLTGLANRRGFDDALDEALRRSDRPFSVALVDVDHFKAINDREGHAAGDELLRTLASTWSPRLPEGAVLARHGGDEFALLLPRHSGREALRTVEELRRLPVGTGLSIGVAQRRSGEVASTLMRRADGALYRAKEAGRDRAELDRGGTKAPRGQRRASRTAE